MSNPVQLAVETLSKALQEDPSFAIAWQSNIAMPIYDGARGRLSHAQANEIADRLMKHLFGVPIPPTPAPRPIPRPTEV